MTRKTNWIVGEALALVVIAGSSTVATSALAEEPLTGPALEKASAAALEHLGGGTVVETEAGENGTPYQVEVRLEDGRTVEVALDANFKVRSTRKGSPSHRDEGYSASEGWAHPNPQRALAGSSRRLHHSPPSQRTLPPPLRPSRCSCASWMIPYRLD